MSMAEYLISETDRLVTGVLDALEIVSAQHRTADCNHIFMNFVYNLPVEYEDVLAAISGFIERHGKRLWRLHVTGSEIRIALEDKEGNVTPIRCMRMFPASSSITTAIKKLPPIRERLY